MGIPKSLTVCIVLAICGAPSAAHQAGPTDQAVVAPALTEAEKDAFIQLAMRSGGLPGLQTVVVKNGQNVWMKSYGFAVLDQPGPRRPMHNDSLMLSASIPKILVTVAVLQQMEKGHLALYSMLGLFLCILCFINNDLVANSGIRMPSSQSHSPLTHRLRPRFVHGVRVGATSSHTPPIARTTPATRRSDMPSAKQAAPIAASRTIDAV